MAASVDLQPAMSLIVGFWPRLIWELLVHSWLILAFSISIRGDVLSDMAVEVPQPMGLAFGVGDGRKMLLQL